MNKILMNVWGVLLTILVYFLILRIKKVKILNGVNSVLGTVGIIMAMLIAFNIDYESYEASVTPISNTLSPLVVFLAVPLYKQRLLLRKNYKAIVSGILISSSVSTIFVIAASKLLGVDDQIMKTLVPKSITTPMAISMSDMIGGISGITVVSVIVAGIIGASTISLVLRLTGIVCPIAIGVCLGSTAHGIGTSKAIEIGEEAGAISGLAMGLTGVFFILVTSVYTSLF